MAQDMVFDKPGTLDMRFQGENPADVDNEQSFKVASRPSSSQKWVGLTMFNTEEVWLL